VTLTVADASGNFAADSLVVTVNDLAGPDGGIPLWVWLLLLVAVALAILALFLYRRRRSAPEQTGPEPSPTAGEDAKREDVVGPAAEESTNPPKTPEPANPVPGEGQP